MINSSLSVFNVGRRRVLSLIGLGALSGCSSINLTSPDARRSSVPNLAEALSEDVHTYIGFGEHRSGSRGERLTANWLDEQLSQAGFQVRNQNFEVPNFDRQSAWVTLDDGTHIELEVQAPFRKAKGSGLLAYWSVASKPTQISGKIVLFEAPYHRHSTLLNPMFEDVVEACLNEQAKALIIITNGPSFDPLWLNTPSDFLAPPIAILAPRFAEPLRRHANLGRRARISLPPSNGVRSSSNIIAHRPGPGTSIVISTPISGWGICAAERGPGVALFLNLARALPRLIEEKLDLYFVATSGHELENLGAHYFLQEEAPKPEETSLWVHLGAGIAARDWHEAGSGVLLPLTSADPQRFLGVTPSLSNAAKRAFTGVGGLERIYPVGPGEAAGELNSILAAGYTTVAGAFGAHRYHHSYNDDDRCINRELLYPVYSAFESMIVQALA